MADELLPIGLQGKKKRLLEITTGVVAEQVSAIIAAGTAVIGAVVGNVESGAADSGAPVKVGGKYLASLPTHINGYRGDFQIDVNGRQLARTIIETTGGGDPISTRLWPYGLDSSAPNLLYGLPVNAFAMMLGPTNAERVRNNQSGTLLASAARTATTSSADQVNYNNRSLYVFFSITAVPGIESVTLTVAVKDPIAGTYETILSGAAETATGTKCYLVSPGIGVAAGGVDVVSGYPVPRDYRITVTHSASGSFSYSVGFALGA